MTPEHTGYSVIAFILERLGTTPILLFLAIMGLGPWVTNVWLEWKRDKRMTKVFERQDQRFEEVVGMYKSNVELVKSHEKINENLQDLVILTTSTMQTLVDHIKSNLFCPLMRHPKISGGAPDE
jgi:hypothetical protein